MRQLANDKSKVIKKAVKGSYAVIQDCHDYITEAKENNSYWVISKTMLCKKIDLALKIYGTLFI